VHTGRVEESDSKCPSVISTMYGLDMDTPAVERVSSWLQNFDKNLCTSSSLWDSILGVRDAPRNRSSPVPISGKGSPRGMPHGALSFFLHDQGEDHEKVEW